MRATHTPLAGGDIHDTGGGGLDGGGGGGKG